MADSTPTSTTQQLEQHAQLEPRALLLHLSQESDEQLEPFSALADRQRDWRELVDFRVDDLIVWSRKRPGVRR
jgi:hypothetical protein